MFVFGVNMVDGRVYFCIDMKSFFASVECAERGLNPFDSNLVVTDKSRGKGAICLAISPKLKELGVPNRCRVFQIPNNIEYITAKPRMKKYIEYASEIYGIYLKYVDKNDIHVYSIDESFIDATAYLKLYGFTAKDFAKKIISDIWEKLHIPATVGIGTNLYLAKVALDITAKTAEDFIGFLDEKIFIKTLWNHRPITDFWQIANGIARRLEKLGIRDMKGLANFPEKLLYKEFGINAELLIDHAWGKESCQMQDIKSYKGKKHSVSTSQILFEDYTFDKARVVLAEMIRDGSYDLMSRGVMTNRFNFFIGYSDVSTLERFHIKMPSVTNLSAVMTPYVLKTFDEGVDKSKLIRKLGIEFIDVVEEAFETYDLLTDNRVVNKEKYAEKVALDIKEKFGKSAVLRASDLQDGATARIRHTLVGGHNGE